MTEEPESLYWADQLAENIIKERGKKPEYVIASGISTSGSVHIGRLREEMTVDIVRRALISKGVKVKYIHSWDDLDRFRKVPTNVPPAWQDHIGKATTKVPDPWGCHKSYSEHFKSEFLESAAKLGLKPEYQSQTELYEKCVYKDEIKTALLKNELIKQILNKFRDENLGEHWYPVEIYCEKCKTDATKITNYDGDYTLSYDCACGNADKVDFSKKGIVKLRWRIDWAMRWAFYNVDFEPAGKEHSTPGGSRDTSKLICEQVYNSQSPTYQMYDFVILKGEGGKMSASAGNVILPKDLLEVYLPEIVRFFYAGARPKTEFAVPLDTDVFKEYEDFYVAERVYYKKEEGVDKKKAAHLKRVYEMSVVDKPEKKMPVQIPFKYLVILSQFYPDDEKIIEKLIGSGHIKKTQKKDSRIKQLIACARNWVKDYAPEEYVYKVQEEKFGDLETKEKDVLEILMETLNKNFTESDLYAIDKVSGLGGHFFKLCYKILLNKERGPRLVELIDIIGKEKVKEIIKKYL
jgi:lysyl-tRNA synthetase class 1